MKAVSAKTYTHVVRNFGPVFDVNSRVLILGSFPSVKSREAAFYYGHPQNRFWKILFSILDEEASDDMESKKALVLKHKIALWDVLDSCDIIGSSDSCIKNAVPVPIMDILDTTEIESIFCNGATSFNLYQKYLEPVTGMSAIKLPSSSPANAAWSLERLTDEWRSLIIPHLL